MGDGCACGARLVHLEGGRCERCYLGSLGPGGCRARGGMRCRWVDERHLPPGISLCLFTPSPAAPRDTHTHTHTHTHTSSVCMHSQRRPGLLEAMTRKTTRSMCLSSLGFLITAFLHQLPSSQPRVRAENDRMQWRRETHGLWWLKMG